MHWTHKLLIWIGAAMFLPIAFGQQSPPAEQSTDLSDRVIQQVLEPLRAGMQTQNVQRVLSVFDKKELNSYSDLERQLSAFFQQFSEVNFRYQLLQVTAENDRGSATAEMQMDALPYGSTQARPRGLEDRRVHASRLF